MNRLAAVSKVRTERLLGPLEDEVVARAGDDLAAMLEREEHDAQAR